MDDESIPDYVYEMSMDEMINWLSRTSSSQLPVSSGSTEEPFSPDTKENASSLLLHFVQRIRDGEKPDPLAQKFALDVLEKVASGRRPFDIGKGEKKISFQGERWRASVIRVLIDLGAKQREVASMFFVSERTISSWYAYAKKNSARDDSIYWSIISHLEQHNIEALNARDLRSICATITSWKDIEYKPRRV